MAILIKGVILIIAILIAYGIFKIFKSILGFVISLLIILVLGYAGYIGYTYKPTNTSEFINILKDDITNKTEDVSDNQSTKTPQYEETDILSQLLSYTKNSSPGENKNYYWENGHALIDTTTINDGEIAFSADSQGRSSTAQAKLTYTMYADSKGSRQGDPLDPPNDGWPKSNPKKPIYSSLTDRTYNGYFYNRSHSIADSLAGKGSYESPLNFTAGTRMQNVGANQNGGMRAPEIYVETYWKDHPNSDTIIQYQTTPVYNKDENIPRGSIVDVKSSDGILDKQFIIINSAEGWAIDYYTGAITAI